MLVQKVYAVVGTSAPSVAAFTGVSSVSQIFNFILNLLLGIGWGLVVVMVALGFVQYTLSQGDKAKVETAQKWLTYAVIGGIGLAITTALKAILTNILGSVTEY